MSKQEKQERAAPMTSEEVRNATLEMGCPCSVTLDIDRVGRQSRLPLIECMHTQRFTCTIYCLKLQQWCPVYDNQQNGHSDADTNASYIFFPRPS